VSDREPTELLTLAQLGGKGIRWYRDRIHDPADPLPAFLLGNRYVVKRVDFDAWLRRRVVTTPLDRLVDDVLRELTVRPA
jgi:hypothetical protein